MVDYLQKTGKHKFHFVSTKKFVGEKLNRAILNQMETGYVGDIGHCVVCKCCGLKSVLWERDPR